MRIRAKNSRVALALMLAASFFLPCFDFCPEDDGGENCPPVCVSCLGCPRTSTMTPSVAGSIVAADSVGAAPRGIVRCALPILPDDIPHVPLAFAA
ncbi:MAG: hypothetical protein NDJ92_07230 [Thermoanaerobaculia bacterium]|nr:hypothetical protein [Thermoanaerobaculia bacterium]